METLAYLQLAQDFENSESKELVFLKDGLPLLKSLSDFQLPSKATLVLLGLASSALILGITGTAQAQTVYPGDSGSTVSYLQRLLTDNGYFVPETGFFGSQTEAAVLSFQSNTPSLAIDGVAGPATFAALEGFTPILPGGSLRFGDSGSDVVTLQNLLTDNGYFVPATGYFGTLTEEQVLAFQRDEGLSVDGIAGSATFAALEGFRPIEPGLVLRFGDSGADVEVLQELLNDNGLFVPVTGFFGDQTLRVLLTFQRVQGLDADGVAGPATFRALRT
ncbi:MAG: peptidoglycan-binding protein [Cyanobacteria bacterium CRU_2_1]|nr:peptidoglycan-binding protein [Cyanobacteria bacterium RU_5_0]NJR62974.1 peptidoglycan-binding protein [Cyanobacteria bacterium CRU_2_1]